MAAINKPDSNRQLNRDNLDRIFALLDYRLRENHSDPIEIVVCGGTSLICSGWSTRVTKDVDVLALASSGELRSPDPLPKDLLKASVEVAEDWDSPTIG